LCGASWSQKPIGANRGRWHTSDIHGTEDIGCANFTTM
jgi:hypothetical protein